MTQLPEMTREGRQATGDAPSDSTRARGGRSALGAFNDVTRPYRYILPASSLVFAVFAYPIARGFSTSLHIDTPRTPDRPFVGADNYRDLLQDSDFWNSFQNSVTFVLGTIAVGMVLAMIFALVLHHAPFSPLKRGLRALSLAPWLISGVAAATMFRFLFNPQVGLIGVLDFLPFIDGGTWLGDPFRAVVVIIIANTWYITPFSTLILLAGMQTIDPDLYEAASIDGASGVQLFRHITLPSLAPHIALTLVYFSFASWNTFDLVLTMTAGGPGRATEVMALYMYRLAFTNLNFSTAAGVMMVLLVLNIFFSIFYLKSFKIND